MTKTLTPVKAIRAHCIWCCGGAIAGDDSPRGCNSPDCGLYALRMGKRPTGSSPMKAIRIRCLDCADTSAKVRDCTETLCDLFPLRSGRTGRKTGRKPKHGFKAKLA